MPRHAKVYSNIGKDYRRIKEKSEEAFKMFKSDYKNDDWNNIIDRFHIPDEKINSNLKDFSKRI